MNLKNVIIVASLTLSIHCGDEDKKNDDKTNTSSLSGIELYNNNCTGAGCHGNYNNSSMRGSGVTSESIKKAIEEKLKSLEKSFSLIADLTPKNLDEATNRLHSRLKQLNENIDHTRVEQEVIILIQKLDISEELDRIESHVKEMKKVLFRKEPIGRRLDFILQELARETNTLGAKSNNMNISAATIEMKVLLEQLREQVQNIE